MTNFWKEIQRRNVIKAAISYIVFSWIILQAVTLLYPSIGWGQVAINNTLIILIIGFPLWLVFAFVFEWTPKGFKKAENVKEEESITASTNKRLNVIIIGGLCLAVLLLVSDRIFKFTESSDFENAIAVLPFDNISADANNQWISDGMTLSISTKLKRIKDLVVIGSTSVKKIKDSEVSTSEIAKKLGVSRLVKGSVTIHENKARITTQLINENNILLWTEEYDVVLEDILNVQSTVANKIVKELQITLAPKELQYIQYNPTDNLAAYKLYQRGKMLADTRRTENFKKAFQLYQQAVLIDTLFAEAYAEIGHMYYFLGRDGVIEREEAYNEIKKLSDKAIAINPNISRAYSILALRLLLAGNKYSQDEYRAHYEKAIEINPNDATAYMQLADSYKNSNVEKSLLLTIEAVRIEPLSVAANSILIWYLTKKGRYKEAEEHFDKTKYLYDDRTKKRIVTFTIIAKAKKTSNDKKDWTESIRIYEDALKQYPDNYEFNRMLGLDYDAILNDNINYLKYVKKAYEIDSNNFNNLYVYQNALIENDKFIEAKRLMNSENYKRIPIGWRLGSWWEYYYYKKDYLNAQKIFEDTNFIDLGLEKPYTLAQLGNEKEVYHFLIGIRLIVLRKPMFLPS